MRLPFRTGIAGEGRKRGKGAAGATGRVGLTSSRRNTSTRTHAPRRAWTAASNRFSQRIYVHFRVKIRSFSSSSFSIELNCSFSNVLFAVAVITTSSLSHHRLTTRAASPPPRHARNVSGLINQDFGMIPVIASSLIKQILDYSEGLL